MGMGDPEKAHAKEKKQGGQMHIQWDSKKSTTDGCRLDSDQLGRGKKLFNAACEGGG